MLTLDQVRNALKDRNLVVVSESTGLHYQTVCRVARAADKQVSYQVVKALSDYLLTTEKES